MLVDVAPGDVNVQAPALSRLKSGEVLLNYKKVLVPELNTGQLRLLLRGTYLVDAIGLNKVQGRPFLVSEIEDKIQQVINKSGDTSITHEVDNVVDEIVYDADER